MEAPKLYCRNPKNIKAFVLGCDPTAFDTKRVRIVFDNVFGIKEDNCNNGDNRYFSSILKNLNELDLSLDNIYVQNLVTDYQNMETGKNNQWKKIAKKYIPARKQELDEKDPSGLIPVFLTSEYLYKVLINEGQVIHSAKELYENEELVPIKAQSNLLERPLIPLYRHMDYNFSIKKDYKERIKKLITE